VKVTVDFTNLFEQATCHELYLHQVRWAQGPAPQLAGEIQQDAPLNTSSVDLRLPDSSEYIEPNSDEVTLRLTSLSPEERPVRACSNARTREPSDSSGPAGVRGSCRMQKLTGAADTSGTRPPTLPR
jgi:hypothetical protein